MACGIRGFKKAIVLGALSNSFVRRSMISSVSRGSSIQMKGGEMGRRNSWTIGDLSFLHCSKEYPKASFVFLYCARTSGRSPEMRLAEA